MFIGFRLRTYPCCNLQWLEARKIHIFQLIKSLSGQQYYWNELALCIGMVNTCSIDLITQHLSIPAVFDARPFISLQSQTYKFNMEYKIMINTFRT